MYVWGSAKEVELKRKMKKQDKTKGGKDHLQCFGGSFSFATVVSWQLWYLAFLSSLYFVDIKVRTWWYTWEYLLDVIGRTSMPSVSPKPMHLLMSLVAALTPISMCSGKQNNWPVIPDLLTSHYMLSFQLYGCIMLSEMCMCVGGLFEHRARMIYSETFRMTAGANINIGTTVIPF